MKLDIGTKNNMLTIIGEPISQRKRKYVLCKCNCGKEVLVRTDSFLNGHSKSCGCYRENRKIKHGFYGTRIYHIWCEMKTRCNCKTNKDYKHYGERGIQVCDEWNDFKNFYNWSIKNGYKDSLTIDRIDVNKNYSPDNCRWITSFEQQSNRRNNVKVLYEGKVYTKAQLIRKLSISDYQFEKRYRKHVI